MADLSALDSFRYVPPDPSSEISSTCSKIGTAVAVLITAFFSYEQFQHFSQHPFTTNRVTVPRPPGTRADINRCGILVFRDGEPFYNESYFRWKFRYRAIFHGDSKNDEFPRQYHTLPAKTCRVYFDLQPGADPLPYDPSSHSTEEMTGKEAEMGCIDWLAAQAKLKHAIASGAQGLSETIQLQGQYGEAEYWFLQADLESCPKYADESNITCATENEEAEFFDAGTTSIDIGMLDHLSPGKWKWSNHYYNFARDTWIGNEMFFRLIAYTEHDKVWPSILSPTDSSHLVWDSVTARSQPRTVRTKSFTTLYFRLASTVEEVEVTYFSLESAFEGVGAWHGFLFLIIGTTCIYYNNVSHKIMRRYQGMKGSARASREGAEEGEDELHDHTVSTGAAGASHERGEEGEDVVQEITNTKV